MADRMPEGLRKHFEEKNTSEDQKEKHKEALHKANKAKMKRKMEQKG